MARPAVETAWHDESPVTAVGAADSTSTVSLHRVRRACLAVLTLLVLLALSSAWWPTASTSTSRGDVRLEATHEHHLRPGLASELEVRWARDSPGPMVLRVPSEMLGTLGTSVVRPAPDGERAEGDTLVLQWDEQPAAAVVRFEGRVPTRQGPGRPSWEVVASGPGSPVSVTTSLWMLP